MKFLAALALFAGIAGAQTTSTPLTGVWKLIEQTLDGKTTAVEGPGFLIFTGKYYSQLRVPVRPDETEDMTDAARLVSRVAVQAQTGTYEVSGTTVTRHPIAAGVPNNMHPDRVITASFKIEGKTLVLTPGNGGILKYTRVE
jgi:hypothetical protein